MTNNNEIWKPVTVEGFETVYEVSNLGNVRRIGCPNNLLPLHVGAGYLDVILQHKGHRKQIKVHRLAALAFIPNPDNLPYVNHLDENKHNNAVSNLEWCTRSYNMKYGSLVTRMLNTRAAHKNKQVGMFRNGELIDTAPTIKAMSDKYGFNYHMIAQCTSGTTKSYKGYTFSYIDNAKGN